MKKIVLGFVYIAFVTCLSAQEKQSEENVFISAQVVSRYVWRGIDIGGNIPFIHPGIDLELGNEKHSFDFGLWGAYAIGRKSDEEIDLFVTYTFNELLELTFTDYFTYDGSPDGYDLFNYRDGVTPHLLEAQVGFLGTEKLPVSMHFAMMIYGNDARRINADGTQGRIFYSKYAELGYEKEFSNATMNFFIGAAFDKANSDRPEETFYGNEKPGIVNLGCSFEKAILISEKFMPKLEISFISNPSLKTAFMVAGLTF